VLHIAGAGTWLGANIVQAVVPRMALTEGPATASGWYRIAGRLSKVLYIPAAVLILVTGISMVLLRSDEFSFGTAFVGIGFAMIVIGALLGSFVFGPYSERAADAIQANDGAAIKANTGRLAAFGVLDTLLLVVTITAMVLKLGA
jgi:Predicted integral membrane protein (DUF2269)